MNTTSDETPMQHARSGIESLKDMSNDLHAFLDAEPGMHEAAKPLLVALKAGILERKEVLLVLEKAEGCPECGAQTNESCRVDRDIGYCPWSEDMKETDWSGESSF